MDTSTTYLGLKLRSPLVASASPLSRKIETIRKMEDLGVAAVVLYSLFEEQIERDQHDIFEGMEQGTERFGESITYFPFMEEVHIGPEKYLDHIAQARKAVDIPIIASLNGSTLGGWTDYAKKMEEAGAHAIELNLYRVPTEGERTAESIEAEYAEIIRVVKSSVNIPVAVKLSPFFTNMGNLAARLDAVGVDGLVLFNRFYEPDIDPAKLEVKTSVLLSTPAEQRLPMRWIGMLYGNISADLSATSGIHSAEDVIKMIMAGAATTQVCSVLLKNGLESIQQIDKGIRSWMETNEYESIEGMRGNMSRLKCGDPTAYERAQYLKAVGVFR